MASATIRKVAVGLKLNNGTTETGSVKTVNVNLGSLNPATYTGNLSTARASVVAIAAALAPCLDKSLFDVQEAQTFSITD